MNPCPSHGRTPEAGNSASIIVQGIPRKISHITDRLFSSTPNSPFTPITAIKQAIR